VVELLQQQLRVVENTPVGLWLTLGACASALDALLFIKSIDLSLVICKGRQLVVVVVTVEEGLDRTSTKVSHVLFELGILQIFPLFVDVLLIEVVLERRDERSTDSLLREVRPVEIT